MPGGRRHPFSRFEHFDIREAGLGNHNFKGDVLPLRIKGDKLNGEHEPLIRFDLIGPQSTHDRICIGVVPGPSQHNTFARFQTTEVGSDMLSLTPRFNGDGF